MRVSTKGRYALRLLLDLAKHKNNGFIALKDIAERQEISKKYLEQIIPLLNKADILRASRGFQGGYMLAKEPDQYKLGDILRITEGSLAPIACLDEGPDACTRSNHCMTVDIWKGLYDVIVDYVDGITLQDILDREQGVLGDEYYI